jgi:hypothetical protein
MKQVALWIALAFTLATTAPAADDDEDKKKIPEGFVEQILEPTGGKLLRPKDWFYKEGHSEHAFMWTLSKEDTKDGNGSYDTGVRIQVFINPQERTDKSAETHARGFLEKKKKEAGKVHRVIEQVEQELFTRIGLETEEGDYRILYSVFWNNKMDLFVVSISGAKAGDWEKYTKTFDTMSEMTLIDMERFEKGKKETEKAEPKEESKEPEKEQSATTVEGDPEALQGNRK